MKGKRWDYHLVRSAANATRGTLDLWGFLSWMCCIILQCPVPLFDISAYNDSLEWLWPYISRKHCIFILYNCMNGSIERGVYPIIQQRTCQSLHSWQLDLLPISAMTGRTLHSMMKYSSIGKLSFFPSCPVWLICTLLWLLISIEYLGYRLKQLNTFLITYLCFHIYSFFFLSRSLDWCIMKRKTQLLCDLRVIILCKTLNS